MFSVSSKGVRWAAKLVRAADATARFLPCGVRRSRRRCFATADVIAEIEAYGAMEPHPQSLGQVLTVLEPWRAAKFLQTEYPIRCAERIQMIESIPNWQSIPELADVHSRHQWAFSAMRSVERKPTLSKFTAVADDIVNGNKDVVALMAQAVHRLSNERPGEFDSAFVDRFLNDFLLNRIGSNFLMSQYLACVDENRPATGIIDPAVNVTAICRETAAEIAGICRHYTNRTPVIRIQTHDAEKRDSADLEFSFIPQIVSYVVQEILKNSCRATVEVVDSNDELAQRPIDIVICADKQRVMIHVSDRAGGIPFDVGQHVWSYLYTTADKDKTGYLAGHGVGLPISRLYTNYLGGALNLVSLPGFGTHAYIYFPRLASNLVEVVPDKDHSWSAVSKFVL
eukprot:TRINITY_DN80834_c0_g1_i1.p1 TRINITY_DN80834_c0_g1~~TRINITY_DN80834_c0_g1_i1.p1  ORF type:complete len:397 (-),score=52.37 TRINITY_DN80834_c0_g1_i1:74-1264(-)